MRTRATGTILPLFVLALLLLSPVFGQELHVPCEAPLSTLRTLERLPAMRDFSLPFEARIGPLRTLAVENPDDFFIQRHYQDAFRRSYFLADEHDRALAMYRARGSDPLSRYWEARLLMNVEPERSRKTFEELLASHEGFVWPHLDFIQWSTLPGRRDPAEVESRLKQFIALCPESVEAYENASLIEDAELIATAAANMRGALERRNSPLDVRLWPALWSLESRSSQEAGSRNEAIRGDLERLESRPLAPTQDLLWTYRSASDLLGDPEVLTSFEARVAREAPESLLHLSVVQSQWSRENLPPGMESTREDHEAYREKEAEARREWLKRWPNACNLLQSQWFGTVAQARSGENEISEDDLASADKIMWCRAEFPDMGMSVPPLEIMIAEFYVQNKVRLDAVPRLLDEGLKAIEKQEKYRISTELMPAAMRRRQVQDGISMTNERAQHLRAEYLLATGRLAEARGLAEQEVARREEPESGEESPEQERLRMGQRRGWIKLLGDVNAKEGNVEEALSLYRSILGGLSRESLMSPDNPYLTPIKDLYLANGGSEDEWVEWVTSGAPPQESPRGRRPVAFSEALPEFSAIDTAGRKWRLEDLRGKGTFVNYWATWCGPCRGEHPFVQKLYELVKDRDDVQVLTINVDDNPALVEEYMKDKGYAFPVIHDRALADRLLPYVGLPTNYLVNAAGVRTDFYGFWGGEESLQRTIADLEEARDSR